MQLPWWTGIAESALVCAGTVLEWALALYVLTRGGWQRVPVLAALAIFSLVVYQVGIGVAGFAPASEAVTNWLRGTWPGPALLPALWLVLTAALAADEGPEALRPRLRGFFQLAAIFGLGGGSFFATGVFTDLIRRWGRAVSETGRELGYSAAGPLYPLYFAYILVCALWAAANVVLLWRASPPGTPLRARWRWLLLTAALFVAGGVYLGIASMDLALSGIPGDALLIVGMLVMGWSIARYGALVAGEAVAGDFFAFGLHMAAIVAGYGLVFWVFMPHDFLWLERALPLLLLVMATHVLTPRQSLWLQRLLYGPVRGTLRNQLRALAARVVRQPDPISALVEVQESVATLLRTQGAAVEASRLRFVDAPALPVPGAPAATGEATAVMKDVRTEGARTTAAGADPRHGPARGSAAEVAEAVEVVEPVEVAEARESPAAAPTEFRVLVEGALRRLNNLPALSQHPLLEPLVSPVGEGDAGEGADGGGKQPTALERAARLRDELTQAITRLRPPGARPAPGAHGGAGGWLHFLILHEAYVEGRPNKEIMQRYYLSEGTFNRARRRAIDALALDLYQRV